MPSNEEIAGVLERIAALLEAQGANTHRVRAYRVAAQTVKNTGDRVEEMARQAGLAELKELPGIGESLAGLIEEYVNRGRSSLLEELESEANPQAMLSQVPGIGKELAQRVVDELGIGSLEELEQAAHDGRLEKVSGFGPERVRAVQVGLAGLLSGAARRRLAQGGEAQPETRPSIETLLEVDAEYRRKAKAGELQRIAPKRFNPAGEAWLPILNTSREGWSFTALYSNTATAHRLGKTDDWVVIYYKRPGVEEDQVTVVTETQGALKGKRVVRGHEAESARYYERKPD